MARAPITVQAMIRLINKIQDNDRAFADGGGIVNCKIKIAGHFEVDALFELGGKAKAELKPGGTIFVENLADLPEAEAMAGFQRDKDATVYLELEHTHSIGGPGV